MKKIIFLTTFYLLFEDAICQQRTPAIKYDTIQILPQEKWFGAAVNEGDKMPFEEGYNLVVIKEKR